MSKANKIELEKNYDISKYDRPSITVDVLIFTIEDGQLKTVLVKRGIPPFKEMWAVPGGFVKMDEPLEEAAKRELAQETGLKNVYLEQLYTFGEPDRDPRTRVITVAYFALAPIDKLKLSASTDVTQAQLFPIKELPMLAFDHQDIIAYAINRLKNKIEYSSIAYGLLPKAFRLSDLQRVYEIILNKKLDKRNFRRRILTLGLLKEAGKIDKDGAHRPAKLYQFKKREIVFFN